MGLTRELCMCRVHFPPRGAVRRLEGSDLRDQEAPPRYSARARVLREIAEPNPCRVVDASPVLGRPPTTRTSASEGAYLPALQFSCRIGRCSPVAAASLRRRLLEALAELFVRLK